MNRVVAWALCNINGRALAVDQKREAADERMTRYEHVKGRFLRPMIFGDSGLDSRALAAAQQRMLDRPAGRKSCTANPNGYAKEVIEYYLYALQCECPPGDGPGCQFCNPRLAAELAKR